MQKILVPYDGSDPSRRALQFALDQAAGARPLEIHLLNVRDRPLVYGASMAATPIAESNEAQVNQGRGILAPAVELVAAAKLACQTHVVLGNVEHAIVDQATGLGCDQIVMGTHGLGTLKSKFVGSVAATVVHLAHVPVTLIK